MGRKKREREQAARSAKLDEDVRRQIADARAEGEQRIVDEARAKGIDLVGPLGLTAPVIVLDTLPSAGELERKILGLDAVGLEWGGRLEIPVKSPRPRIALCMIVRDEAHVISRLIESVAQHIDFFVICDTGSTDGTMTVIQEHMARLGVPGLLWQDEWVDFGTNRSRMLAKARGQADWLMLMDADWTLDSAYQLLDYLDELGRIVQPEVDAYWVTGAQDLKLAHLVLVRGDKPWKAVGAVHEYVTCEEPYTSRLLDGVQWRHHEDGGQRGEGRAERDEAGLRRQIESGVEAERATFYLGQTLRESGRLEEAFDVYMGRIEMPGGNVEEVFYSLYQAAACAHAKGWTRTMELGLLFRALAMRPERAEPLYEIVWRYRELGEYDAAFELMKAHKKMWAPVYAPDSGLFVHSWVWDWGLPFELSIVEFHRGRFDECWRLSEMLQTEALIPEPQRSQCNENQRLALEQLGGVVPLLLTKEPRLLCATVLQDI